MPEYLSPAVFVEEVSSGNKPIEGVGTSTGAFVGGALKGPVDQPVLVTNFTQYLNSFGGFSTKYFLSYAVRDFFAQGGTRAYVVRVFKETDETAWVAIPNPTPSGEGQVATVVLDEGANSVLEAQAVSTGEWGNKVSVTITHLSEDPDDTANTSNEDFKLEVLYDGTVVETFDRLTLDPAGVVDMVAVENPFFYRSNVNGKSAYVWLADKRTDTGILTPPDEATFDLAGGFRPATTTVSLDVASAEIRWDESALTPASTDFETPLRVGATSPGKWGNGIWVQVGPPSFDPADPNNTDGKFSLTVLYQARSGARPDVVEAFDLLSLKPLTSEGLSNPLYVETVINGTSKFIGVVDTRMIKTDNDSVAPAPAIFALRGGMDGVTALGKDDLIGAPSDGSTDPTGLYAFDRVDDINIVAIPDLMKTTGTGPEDGTKLALAYCEGRGDCFFVADSPSGLDPQGVKAYRQDNGLFSTYGALYYPWIEVSDPLTGGRIPVPPSGAVAGTYSGTDVRRGVHKAPAGTEDGRLRVALGLERQVTMGEHDILNPVGINVIRSFPSAGIVIWGARTLSADPEWRYVNVRRLFLFLEESIDEGTQWTVFEPNDPVLWKRITRNVSAFLRIQWLDGKLVGEKAEDAFFVKCDAETNPPESVDAGRVVTLIGVAPSKPAEFVIFRISQQRPEA